MKLNNAIFVTICLLVTVNLTAQSPIIVNKNNSTNDNTEDFACANHGNILNYFMHVNEPILLYSLSASLENIDNEVVSVSYSFDGPLDNSFPFLKEENSGYSKKSSPWDELEPARYLVTVVLASSVTTAQIPNVPNDGPGRAFRVITDIKYSVGQGIENVDFVTGFRECSRKGATLEPTISTVNISAAPNSNQTLIEFEIFEAEAILSIDALSISQIGIRQNLIDNQKFSVGTHRLLFDNNHLPEGISQIIVRNGKQIRLGKTIRL